MSALDTSVVVPALLSWHEAHQVAREAAAGGYLPAHAQLESYSVLTRLPAPHRIDGDVAHEAIRRWFPRDRVLVPSAKTVRTLVDHLAAAGIEGGAVYDALIGLTSAEHGMELAARDARAARTYARLGIAHHLVGS